LYVSLAGTDAQINHPKRWRLSARRKASGLKLEQPKG
jgi:hypothetical protein